MSTNSEAVAPVDERMLFGQVCMDGAQVAVQTLIARAVQDPYKGSFVGPGEAPLTTGEEGFAERWFGQALVAFAEKNGGAEVVPAQFVEPPAAEEWEKAAPFETVLLLASMPSNSMTPVKEARLCMVEACAEVMRVFLANAIGQAIKDSRESEKVMCRFRGKPEFLCKVHLASGKLTTVGRMRANVTCASEPRASYLLGSVAGQPTAQQFRWELPLVELFYGPNRLHWKDLRAPDARMLVMAASGGTA